MSKTDAAKRALERAVEEETAGIRAELKASQAEVKSLHSVLAKISSIAFGAVGNALAIPAHDVVKRTLPAALAVQAEEELVQDPPIDLSADDDMGPGRFV